MITRPKVCREIALDIMDGSAKQTPFENICGNTFMKFNAFRVEMHKVVFMLDGKDVFYIEHSADFSRGDNFTLTNVDGRMAFHLSGV
jgi:hypothetical protein